MVVFFRCTTDYVFNGQINNVVVEVILNIELSVQVIFPFVSQTLNIEKQLILDSKVIQGNIPDYYGTYSSLKDKS